MKKLLVAGAVAFGCGSICTSAHAWEKAISDTSGYVVQSAGDVPNQNSIISGAHFPGGAPVAGKDYLVNGGLTTRTPVTENADNKFEGASFTLDEGARFLLKGPDSKITIADLRIYNAKISQGDGNSLKTLKGGMTVYGTPSAPSIIEGSGNNGLRRFSIESAISGASGTRIKVQHSEEPDASGAQFYTFLKGDNSGYLGSFEVESAGNGICLVGFNNKAFGSSPDITLTNNGKLFGGASALVFNSNGIFKAQGGSFAISAPVVVKNVGSVSGKEELTNGGTISVDTNQTLTINGVVSGAGILRKTGGGALLLNAANTIAEPLVVKQGFIDGAGKVAAVELKDGAGFDVSAAQTTPFEIGSLAVEGEITLNIRGAANVDTSRIAIAKVGTLTGALGTVKAAMDGGSRRTYRLSVSSGILYATVRRNNHCNKVG